MKRSAFPLNHPTLGFVCQHCLRPFGPWHKPREPSAHAKREIVRNEERARKCPRRGPVQLNKRLLFVAKRDLWICWLCGKPVDKDGPFRHRPSVDHVVPRRDGGTNSYANLKLAHQSCNEYRDGAKVKPFAPILSRSYMKPNP